MDYKYKYIKYKTKYHDLKGGMNGGVVKYDLSGNYPDNNKYIDEHREVYETASKELQSGRKIGHWIWSIFPYIIRNNNVYSYNTNYFCFKNINDDREQSYIEIINFLCNKTLNKNYFNLVKIVKNHLNKYQYYNNVRYLFGNNNDDNKFFSSIKDFTQALLFFKNGQYTKINSKEIKKNCTDLLFNPKQELNLLDLLCDTLLILAKLKYK